MKTIHKSRPIKIFTPSCADESDSNAQNLTVKELVARLPPDRFHVTMILQGGPDPRLAFLAEHLSDPMDQKREHITAYSPLHVFAA